MTPEQLAERIHPSMSVERRHAVGNLEAVRRRTAGIIAEGMAALRAENARLKRAIESFGETPEFDWNVIARLDDLEDENARLKAALSDAIRRPLGVVPDSAVEFVKESRG